MPGAAPRLCRIAGRDTWHIYHERRRLSTGETTRAAAELALRDYIDGLKRSTAPVISVTEVLDRYLTDRRARAIPGLTRLEYAHKPLTRILGNKPPETIGEAETRAYTTRRLKEGVKVATARTELQALRAAMRWAANAKLIGEDPKIKTPPRPESRVRYLTREEADQLVAHCEAPHVRLFTLIALNTGARSGAILGLTWDRVDLGALVIDFRSPGAVQTRKRRGKPPINETLRAALAEAKALATTEFVIEWAGGPIERIKHGFRNACARANLTGVTPHVMRHTAVTRALQAGMSVWDVAGFVDMTPAMVEEVYGHFSDGAARRVARALG